MDVLVVLIPVSLFLGGLGLAAFFWTLRKGQYSDPEGDARRILAPDYEDRPKPVEEAGTDPEAKPDPPDRGQDHDPTGSK